MNILITDMKQILKELAKKTNRIQDEIKSSSCKSEKGDTLANINQIQSEFKNLLT